MEKTILNSMNNKIVVQHIDVCTPLSAGLSPVTTAKN
mgnify:CR=1 FL=1